MRRKSATARNRATQTTRTTTTTRRYRRRRTGGNSGYRQCNMCRGTGRIKLK